MKKRLITILAILGTSILLGGCQSNLTEFANDTLPLAIENRGEINKQWAADFNKIGALDDATYNKICSNIDTQVAKYIKDRAGTTSSDTLGEVADAISQYELGGHGKPSTLSLIDGENTYNLIWDGGAYKAKDSEGNIKFTLTDDTATKSKDVNGGLVLSNFIMSNYLHSNEFSKGGTGSVGDVIHRDTGAIKPIELISNTAVNDINNAVKGEVHVLKSDILRSGETASLDGVIAKVQNLIATGNTAGLQEYFEAAIDIHDVSKGTSAPKIHLVDDDDPDFKLVEKSKPSTLGGASGPGYDLIIPQDELADCLHVRFIEFNQDAYYE
ncbi:MAG: hypothetical protein U0L26_07565, partial [Cellulosilyticum sp.]|nr:hypothetical protein [Cellulosilyticum sp.]